MSSLKLRENETDINQRMNVVQVPLQEPLMHYQGNAS